MEGHTIMVTNCHIFHLLSCHTAVWSKDESLWDLINFMIVFLGMNNFLIISLLCFRMHHAIMFMQTRTLCRGLQLGVKRRSWTPDYLPPQTPAVWSCSAREHGVMLSVMPPCFSSVSSQKAGEEEEAEEEQHLPWHHDNSMRHADLHAKVYTVTVCFVVGPCISNLCSVRILHKCSTCVSMLEVWLSERKNGLNAFVLHFVSTN